MGETPEPTTTAVATGWRKRIDPRRGFRRVQGSSIAILQIVVATTGAYADASTGEVAVPFEPGDNRRSWHTSATIARSTRVWPSAIPLTSALSQITLMMRGIPLDRS